MPTKRIPLLTALALASAIATMPAGIAAAQDRSTHGAGGSSGTPGAGGRGASPPMDMNQMMEHCRQMQGMNRANMSADMKEMAKQCDEMAKSHGHSSGPSGSTTGQQPRR